MNNKILSLLIAIVLIILAIVPNAFAYSDISVKSNILNEKDSLKPISVKNIDEITIQIIINIDEFEFETVSTDNGFFTSINLPGHGFSSNIGKPRLPIIRKMIEIPNDSEPELSVISESWNKVYLDELNLYNKIIPAQVSIEKKPLSNSEFIIDDNYYSKNEFLPETIADIVDIGEIRARRFALIEINPIQYNPITGELILMNSCEIQINLPNSDLTKTYEMIKRYSTPSFENLFDLTFENYGFYEKGIISKEPEGYLIIVYDSFYDEIEPLADWKTSMGYNTTLVKTSEIPGGTTKENIHDYIVNAYNTWNTPPAYVLLIGDTPQIPTYLGSEGPDAVDLYYVTINSGDYFPDIFIGRFPASQASHVTAMVDKTIYYETGNFSDTDWIKKAAFMAGNDNYWISEGTHNHVISTYLEPNGYNCDKIYEVTYGANTQDITNALNAGRSLAIFSGHGSIYNWDDGPYFNQNNVKDLSNEGMYPFVISHACLTGSFQVSECFGETWLREEDKGGIAFWGASESTLWDEDDILERGMFQAWWDDGLDWIGGMTDMALYYVYENYSGGGYSQYYFEAYNILGDPSIKIWRNDPSGSPDIPSKPDGPVQGTVGYEYSFSTSTNDPDNDQIYFMWDWGDGNLSEWMGPYSSGDTCSASHIWNSGGNFTIKVKARDEHFTQSEWSEGSIIQMVYNFPPDKPSISGPYWLIPKVTYNFEISTIEPDGETVFFLVEWGDGDFEEWVGPYSSEEVVTFSHKYTKKGLYKINITAKDINDFESETHQKNIKVSLSRSRIINNPLKFIVFEKIFERFFLLRQLI